MTIPLLLLVCSNSHSCNTRTKINRHVHWMPVCSADHRQCRCCCYWFSFVASDASTISVFIANRELLHHLSHSSLLFRQWILLLASKYAITCKRIRKWFLRTINFSLELKFYIFIVCLCVPLLAKLGWIDRQHLLTLKIFLFRLHNAPGIFTHAKRSIQRTHILIFAASPVSAQLPTRCVHFSVFFFFEGKFSQNRCHGVRVGCRPVATESISIWLTDFHTWRHSSAHEKRCNIWCCACTDKIYMGRRV